MTDLSLSLYRQMLLVRVLEGELQRLCDEGKGSDLHFSTGQEAVSVGVIAGLAPSDYLVCHHRTIAHAVARGVPLAGLIAEVLGKPSGVNRGRAGEMHLSYPEKRLLFSFQLVGTCIPVATGIAWAVKAYQHGEPGNLVAVFFGDAATANGAWHEGVNIAAVQGVPLLLVCENNGLAGNVRTSAYLPHGLGGKVATRAKAYGVASETIDGNHVDTVKDAVLAAANYVRNRQQPYLLECMTTRLSRHKQGQGDLRSAEEKADLGLRDPLLYEERRVGLSIAKEEELLRDVRHEVALALKEAGVE